MEAQKALSECAIFKRRVSLLDNNLNRTDNMACPSRTNAEFTLVQKVPRQDTKGDGAGVQSHSVNSTVIVAPTAATGSLTGALL
jgi:hypothetical protein